MAAQRTLRPDTPEISTSDVTRQADQNSGITATPEPSSDLTEESRPTRRCNAAWSKAVC